jgi:hypothetical protein
VTHLLFRTDPKDSSLIDVLDRILDKGIVLEPWARVVSPMIDLHQIGNRIVLAPERRRKIFVVPETRRK